MKFKQCQPNLIAARYLSIWQGYCVINGAQWELCVFVCVCVLGGIANANVGFSHLKFPSGPVRSEIKKSQKQ